MSSNNLLIQVANTVGEFMEYWGFKSIDGRVWALIHLSDTPISTPEIVKQLDVSKGLVSIAINELLTYELISTSGKTTYGAQTYISSPNVAQIIRKILRERELNLLSLSEAKMKLLVAQSKTELKKENISFERLNSLLDLTSSSKNFLSRMVSKNLNSIEDWSLFLKKAVKILRF